MDEVEWAIQRGGCDCPRIPFGLCCPLRYQRAQEERVERRVMRAVILIGTLDFRPSSQVRRHESHHPGQQAIALAGNRKGSERGCRVDGIGKEAQHSINVSTDLRVWRRMLQV